MEPIDPKEKLEYWREHVRKVALFEGTQGEYSRQNGISASKLSWYKGQFVPKPSFAKVVSKEPTVACPPPQLKTVHEDSNSKIKATDPKWLAIFLREFLR
jgi:hypothetical protein